MTAVGDTSKPFVSCILVTRDRKLLTRRAVHYFNRQCYTRRELVIIDASAEPEPYDGPYVKYFRVPPSTSIGKARNIAIEHGQGDAIVFWDSDDWYAPDYLRAMIDFLTFSDLAALVGFATYDFLLRTAWIRGRAIGGCAFAFWRSVWQSKPFADTSRGEDTIFWKHHKANGKILVELERPNLFVYMRHPNQGTYAIGEPAGNSSLTEDVRTLLRSHGELAFYDELAEIVQEAPPEAKNGPPVLTGGPAPAFHLPGGRTPFTPTRRRV